MTFQTQPHLMSDSGLSVETMRKIYHIKCRELPVKANFPSAFENNFCLFPYCTNEDSQYHIFSSNCFISDSINEITDTSVKYSDIFSDNIQSQVNVVNIMFSRLERRKKYITLSVKGFPLDPRSRHVSTLGIRKAKRTNKRKTIHTLAV